MCLHLPGDRFGEHPCHWECAVSVTEATTWRDVKSKRTVSPSERLSSDVLCPGDQVTPYWVAAAGRGWRRARAARRSSRGSGTAAAGGWRTRLVMVAASGAPGGGGGCARWQGVRQEVGAGSCLGVSVSGRAAGPRARGLAASLETAAATCHLPHKRIKSGWRTSRYAPGRINGYSSTTAAAAAQRTPLRRRRPAQHLPCDDRDPHPHSGVTLHACGKMFRARG